MRPAVGSASPSSSRIRVVLPAPLAPEEAEGTAARDLEVDAVERRSRPEPLAKTAGLDGEGLGFDEGCGVHETTVRAAAGARLGRKAERHPPKRMRCTPPVIRSNEPARSQEQRIDDLVVAIYWLIDRNTAVRELH